MNTLRVSLLICAMVIGLSGCATREESGATIGAITGGLLGNSVGRGRGRIATTAIGAVLGGIIGSEIGRSLDERDRLLAQRAEYAALEKGRSGEPYPWRNPESGRYGEVIPDRPYKRGDLDCREYTHKVYIEGRPQVMRGTACRNGDGSWSRVG